MDEKLLSELRALGFSEKEAQVYVAAMQLGTSTMQKISKIAGVNRATTYVVVESLMQRGLMSSVTKGKKRYFTVEDPGRLGTLLDRQKMELAEKEKSIQQVLPKLSQMFEITKGGEKPQVRFYEGYLGLHAIREEILKSKKKEAFSIFNADAINRIFTDAERKSFTEKRVDKKILSHAIYTSSEGSVYKDNKATLSNYTFIPNDLYNSPIDITVFDNKVLITSLKDPVIAVMIESQDIASSFHQILGLIERIPEAKDVKERS